MKTAPTSIDELMARCRLLEGLSFGQLAKKLGYSIPELQLRRKGWMGMLVEMALGADAKTLPSPDFKQLQIELKTLPLDKQGKPCESTFVTSIPLLTIGQESWQSSSVYEKLKQVLWLPIEGDRVISYANRRIGQAILWSPDESQLAQLKQDWMELVELIQLGQLESIDATMGTFLQVRPKAANGKSLCDGYDVYGNKIKTLPRGFYLRTSFTQQVLQNQYLCHTE